MGEQDPLDEKSGGTTTSVGGGIGGTSPTCGRPWRTPSRRQAQVQGDRAFTWAEFDRRADGIAATLLAAGARASGQGGALPLQLPRVPGVHVRHAYKAGLVPVNTNYRYTDDELVYLWDNADAVAVVFHGTFAERCAAMRDRLPGMRTWLWVDDGTDPCPRLGRALRGRGRQPAPQAGCAPSVGPHPRRPFLLYTGGTTGMPKGVMWRQDDIVGSLDGAARSASRPAATGWTRRPRSPSRAAQPARRPR